MYKNYLFYQYIQNVKQISEKCTSLDLLKLESNLNDFFFSLIRISKYYSHTPQ